MKVFPSYFVILNPTISPASVVRSLLNFYSEVKLISLHYNDVILS